MIKRIVLISNSFPYGYGESFLEPEMAYVPDGIDYYIVPIHKYPNRLRDVSKNTKVVDLEQVESKKNIYAGAESNTQNYNFLMQESQTSSTFAQVSNDVQNFKKREKSGKKDKKKAHHFQYFQIGILLLSIMILLFQVLIHILLNISLSNIGNQNDAVLLLRQFSGLFNNIFTSTLSLACLDKAPQPLPCMSVVNYFQRVLNPKPGPPLFIFLFFSSKGMCNPLLTVRENILKILSDSKDKSLSNLLNSEIISLSISQNITSSGNKLIALKKKIPFIEVMNYITNSLVILTSDVSNLETNVIYLLNRIDYYGNWTSSEQPFIYIRLNGQLSPYQFNFYYFHNLCYHYLTLYKYQFHTR